MVLQGKAHRDKQLIYLKDHLEKYYHSRDRKWVVLFPEGGFLRKRRETSQMFAKKHGLPHLSHVTLPRLGATHVILKTLSAQQENGSVGSESGTPNQTGNTHALQYISTIFFLFTRFWSVLKHVLSASSTPDVTLGLRDMSHLFICAPLSSGCPVWK